MPNSYSEGQRIKTTGTFTDLNGALVDPAIVRFHAISDQTPTIVTVNALYGVDPDITKVSTGVYRYDLLLNRHGHWQYGYTGEGSHEGALWGTVYADESPF